MSRCRKGIILAGGTGSRLFPTTQVINKQLLPLYDKPIIYYPLTTLMLAGITEILVVSREIDLPAFKQLLKDGQQWGLNITYAVQDEPRGLPEAFIIGEKFINGDPVALVLGDNVFHGQGLSTLLYDVAHNPVGSHLFSFSVKDPKRYGVLIFDKKGEVVGIEEKPEVPKSKSAVTGLYFYDSNVVELSKSLKPSKRGELEITDLNCLYVQQGMTKVHELGRGYVWFDVGTPEALHQASDYVHIVQSRQGVGIACPEEVAWRMKYINNEQLALLVNNLPASIYSNYLSNLMVEEKIAEEVVTC